MDTVFIIFIITTVITAFVLGLFVGQFHEQIANNDIHILTVFCILLAWFSISSFFTVTTYDDFREALIDKYDHHEIVWVNEETTLKTVDDSTVTHTYKITGPRRLRNIKSFERMHK